MAKKENSFLDTSVILSREFGFQSVRERIRECLGDSSKYSTTYTKMEVNRTFLLDLIYLYSLLIEEGDFSTVFKRLKKLPLTERRKNRILDILSSVTDKRQLRFADAITRLESLITGLRPLLFKDIHFFASKTDCPLADAEPESSHQTYRIQISCTRRSPSCNVVQFLKNNREDLLEVSNQENLNSKLSKFLKNLFSDFGIAKGRNCRIMGDTIVCLESPSNFTIFSTDADFVPICRALGKKLNALKTI